MLPQQGFPSETYEKEKEGSLWGDAAEKMKTVAAELFLFVHKKGPALVHATFMHPLLNDINAQSN